MPNWLRAMRCMLTVWVRAHVSARLAPNLIGDVDDENSWENRLVVEGGGMKCAYNAGILDAFIDEQITFDYCIGVSAGAGNLASYLAGRRSGICAFSQIISIRPTISD